MAENVRIYLRIRPSRSEEANNRNNTTSGPSSNNYCLMVDPQNPKQAVTLFSGSKAEVFTYDCVGGPETEQEDIFESVAKPVTEYCLQGYNGTIFAYGQTGSGKTFTMQGPMTEANLIDFNQRGLIPRTFEYLFECIRAEEEAAAVDDSGREFLCKCSYVEIYNETIFDLLEISGSPGTCNLREDIKRGVYIEGAKEEMINSPSEAYEVYERGSLNRHVAETSMNRESSRSHSVFTLFIQSKQRVGEIMDVRESRFNLVDLAGSERQQMTGTTGQRLKEAGNINKSLLALSNVINGLVDISNGRARHVQYRDSKLTFLLRDSLGGNAKTVIIANVSPSSVYYNETLSTLKFAQRAKMIKNKAVVNKDIQGNVLQLQAEIQRLQHELYLARHSMDIVNADDSMMMKRPRLIQGTNEDELDPAEAYLMLTMALERQAESSDEIESLKSKVHLLEEMVKRKESQNQSIRMILKFRENSLKSHQTPARESEEISDLKEEINELRKIIEHHPEVTRFAYENLQLREKLYKYEGNEKKFEEFHTIIGRHKQYEQLLTNRILVLEKKESIKDQENSNSGSGSGSMCTCEHIKTCDTLPDDVDIKMQSINVNLEEKDEIIESLEKKIKETESNYEGIISDIEQKYKIVISDIEQKHKVMISDIEEEYKGIISDNEKKMIDNEEEYKQALIDVKQTILSSQQIISDNENIINDIKGQLDDQSKSIERLKDEIEAKSEVLQVERESISSLMQEKGELLFKLEQFEKQKEQSKLLLSNYEKVKIEFNEKISELNLEISKGLEEVEISVKRLKTAQSENSLLKQELEVTRQILAEYKSKDQNTSTSQIQAAEQAGKRISELETEISKLNDQISQLTAQTQNSTLLADRNKILQAENGQLHGKIGKLEFLMRSAQSDNDELMGQLAQLQKHLESSLRSSQASNPNNTKDQDLDQDLDKIMALQNQLEAANHTISSMKRQLSSLESDLSDLRSENDKLTQHQNLKQKLQYHLKIKQENNELQEELAKCRDELMQIKTKQENLVHVLSDIKTAASAANGVKNVDRILQLIKTLSL